MRLCITGQSAAAAGSSMLPNSALGEVKVGSFLEGTTMRLVRCQIEQAFGWKFLHIRPQNFPTHSPPYFHILAHHSKIDDFPPYQSSIYFILKLNC